MPLDELLAKYHSTEAQDEDADAGLFLYSPASLSDASDTSDGECDIIKVLCIDMFLIIYP